MNHDKYFKNIKKITLNEDSSTHDIRTEILHYINNLKDSYQKQIDDIHNTTNNDKGILFLHGALYGLESLEKKLKGNN